MTFDIRKKDQALLNKVARWEKEKKERREMRRKANKKKAKEKQIIKKQRHLARLNPQPVTITGVGGGDSFRKNPDNGKFERIVELEFQAPPNGTEVIELLKRRTPRMIIIDQEVIELTSNAD